MVDNNKYMIKEIKFALYVIKKNIQSSIELRSSFLLNVFGMAINDTAFIILWVYFVKSVGVVGGWTTYDIIGMLGISALTFGIVYTTCYGLFKLPDNVASGSFDRFMLSPKNILIRTATSAIEVAAVGDMLFGIICICIYGFLIHITLMQMILILILIFFTSIVFLSFMIIIYSLSFYFIDANVITNGIFQLFNTPTLFHGGAFQGALRFVFTFIIPSLLISAIPLETIKNTSYRSLFMIIILSFVWLFIAIKFFNISIKKYESSNFMTFGN